jgi:hypothetical protein
MQRSKRFAPAYARYGKDARILGRKPLAAPMPEQGSRLGSEACLDACLAYHSVQLDELVVTATWRRDVLSVSEQSDASRGLWQRRETVHGHLATGRGLRWSGQGRDLMRHGRCARLGRWAIQAVQLAGIYQVTGERLSAVALRVAAMGEGSVPQGRLRP